MKPPFTPTAEQDQSIDVTISYLLRIGVTLSALVVAVGGIWYLIQHGSKLPSYARFVSEPSDLLSTSSTLREAEHFDSSAIIMSGLLILIATPVLRVAFTIFAFAREKDWTYVTVAAIVLSILLFGLAH